MNNTGLIILAAGASTRLGRPKQLLPWKGKTLISHVVSEALEARLSPAVVVTGAHASEVSRELSGLNIIVAHNPAWEEGMASSITKGLQTVIQQSPPALDAVILSVCDQPFLSAHIFNALIQCRNKTQSLIVASAYAENIGTPVLFASPLFDQLMTLKGDSGAKKLIHLHHYESISFPEGELDIDNQQDYDQL